jgi:uncharacterized membrane protein
MVEPSAIAIVTAFMVPILAGLLYIIRAEIRKNTATTDLTHEQVIPNHGTSLRDAVDRIEKRIDGVHEDITYVRSRVDRHIDDHDHGKA